MKIHIVYAVTEHEHNINSSDAIKAFTSRRKAKAFLDRCCRHSKKRPMMVLSWTWDSKIWDKWNEDLEEQRDKDFEVWKKKHPAGERFADVDSFQLGSAELVK